MKGEKKALWEKAPKVEGMPEGANELLMKSGGISMPVGTGSEPGGEEKPKYKKMEPTIEDKPSDMGGTKSKSAAAGAYAGEMGTGKEKLSPMAQKVGSSRKGY